MNNFSPNSVYYVASTKATEDINSLVAPITTSGLATLSGGLIVTGSAGLTVTGSGGLSVAGSTVLSGATTVTGSGGLIVTGTGAVTIGSGVTTINGPVRIENGTVAIVKSVVTTFTTSPASPTAAHLIGGIIVVSTPSTCSLVLPLGTSIETQLSTTYGTLSDGDTFVTRIVYTSAASGQTLTLSVTLGDTGVTISGPTSFVSKAAPSFSFVRTSANTYVCY